MCLYDNLLGTNKYSSWFPKKNPPGSFTSQQARRHVWIGSSLMTRSGLKKADLVLRPDGKIVSKKRLKKRTA